MGWEMSFITITVLWFGYQVFNLANCVFNLVNCVTTLPTEVGVGGSCIIKQEWLICKKFLGLLFVQMVMLLRENFGPCNVKIFGQKC